MSRPLRIEYPGAWHHVLNRGWNKITVFEDKTDHFKFIELLKQAGKMFKLQVSAYCLMPNHFHLLVQTPEGNLARGMRHVGSLYTQYYNNKHKSDGPLFKGRYKSILVEEESYLLRLVRYIHQNPIKAELANRLEMYPWSSHQGYLSNAAKWDWLNKGPVLDRFTSKREYLSFVSENELEAERIFTMGRIPSVLGCERFMEWVKESFFEKTRSREVPQSALLAPTRERIIQALCQKCGIEREEIFKSRRGHENVPRKMAIYLMRTMRGENTADIAKLFRLKTYSSVSSAIRRVERQLRRDERLRMLTIEVESLAVSMANGESGYSNPPGMGHPWT
jgi:putative transposase